METRYKIYNCEDEPFVTVATFQAKKGTDPFMIDLWKVTAVKNFRSMSEAKEYLNWK